MIKVIGGIRVPTCDCPQNLKNGPDFDCILPCQANRCCENGPNPLCCQNGVCNDDNFVFNGTNANECQCLCSVNFSGCINL